METIRLNGKDMTNFTTTSCHLVSSDHINLRVEAVSKNEFIDTLQLIFSDLLDHTIQGNDTAKLFYLKSKINALDNGHSLTREQHNYLTILISELTKFNKEHKLPE